MREIVLAGIPIFVWLFIAAVTLVSLGVAVLAIGKPARLDQGV